MFDHLAKDASYRLSPGGASPRRRGRSASSPRTQPHVPRPIDVIPRDLGGDAALRNRPARENRYKVTEREDLRARDWAGIMYNPGRRPHPEIVGTVVAAPFKRRDRHGRARLSSRSSANSSPALAAQPLENYAEGKPPRREGFPIPAEVAPSRATSSSPDGRTVAERLRARGLLAPTVSTEAACAKR